jgi:predicted unusual protein kinase regulating ubiquinone biosynthesis (AarF/ABC1/UbiB family)
MNRLVKTNVLYVKVFQAFALNHNLIDEEFSNELLSFTDNAPWNDDDIDWYTIWDIQKEYNLDFNQYNYSPINSGMISIVFKAFKLDTNETVIIKMKRENIESKLQKAINNLLFVVYIFSFIPDLNKLNLCNIVQNNIDVLSKQVDFKNEVQNMQRMGSHFKDHPQIIIPKVCSEVTDHFPNIIMMEFLEGKTITKIDTEDHIHFAKLTIKFGVISLLIHGIGHGDLHIGNILFIKDENAVNYKHKIGILDFGIVNEIDNYTRDQLLNIYVDLFQVDDKVIATHFLYSGLLEPIENIEKLPNYHRDNIIALISNMLVKNTLVKENAPMQIHLFQTIFKLKEYIEENDLIKFGIKPSDTFIKLQLSHAMTSGIISTFDKYENYCNIMDEVITEMFHLDILLDDEPDLN